ncbi:MAG: plastocyanin/azurin family copper-binding protein [Halobacteriales archaeon]|nr:plastocyanin/azurin family copper-binding protein [Halobacteriales archaeon]
MLEATAGAALFGLAGCLGAPVGASTQSPTDGGHDHEEDDHHEETETHGEDDHHEHSPTEHESGHGHDHGSAVTPASDAATVRMTTTDSGEHFEPHVTWVNPGGTVTFVNESGTHSATAYHPDNDKPLLMPEDASPFDSGLLTEEGAEFIHTFETAGVYHFYCAPHESLGMLGSVIVGEPDPHGQPALEEVPSSLPESAQEKIEHLNEKCNEALGHEH